MSCPMKSFPQMGSLFHEMPSSTFRVLCEFGRYVQLLSLTTLVLCTRSAKHYFGLDLQLLSLPVRPGRSCELWKLGDVMSGRAYSDP